MWVNFLCRLLFPYPFHPSFTAVTHKRSQKCRWQVTAHASYICIFEWNDIVNWCMVAWCAHNLHQDGSSFRWHQPCNNQIVLSLHHFVGYWKTCYYFIFNEGCSQSFRIICDTSTVSLLKSREQCYIKAIDNNNKVQCVTGRKLGGGGGGG